MSEHDSDKTQRQQRGLIPFKPGQSGNPKGRPKGSRNKLAESFLADLLESWENHGKRALTDMIEDKPGDYVKCVAATLPKHFVVEDKDPLEDMNVDELSDYAARAASRVLELAESIAALRAEEGADEAGVLPPLH